MRTALLTGCSRSTPTAYAAPLAPAPSRAGAFCLERRQHPRFDVLNGIRFPVGLQTESASRNPRLEWDALSGIAFNRKLRPGISIQSGMPFPAEPSGGKFIPELTLRAGHGFRIAPQPETVSHSETGFRDTLSARPAIRKVHPVLSVQTGTRFPLAWPLGKRGPDRGGCDPAMRGLAAPTAPLR